MAANGGKKKRSSKGPGSKPVGVTTVCLTHAWPEHAANGQSRTDLVFDGVSHSDGSYEVRAFLNNKKATLDSPKSIEVGYAGRFVVFGHGGCFGSPGHCNYQAAARDPFNPERRHPVEPVKRIITIPQELIDRQMSKGQGVESLTLVAISRPGDRAGRCATDDLFSFSRVSLRTYL